MSSNLGKHISCVNSAECVGRCAMSLNHISGAVSEHFPALVRVKAGAGDLDDASIRPFRRKPLVFLWLGLSQFYFN